MQFIVAFIADDTAVCDMVSVDIDDLRKAVVVVDEVSALGIEHIPNSVHSDYIRNVTVQSCLSPYYTTVQSVIYAQLISLTGIVHTSTAAVLPHIFVYSLSLSVVRAVIGKNSFRLSGEFSPSRCRW